MPHFLALKNKQTGAPGFLTRVQVVSSLTEKANEAYTQYSESVLRQKLYTCAEVFFSQSGFAALKNKQTGALEV